jgi:hypothetical protein
MTLSTVYEMQRRDERLERLAEENEKYLTSRDEPNILPLAAICLSAASISPLSIEKIVGNAELAQVMPTIEVTIDTRKRLDYPWGRNKRRVRPIVRGEQRTDEHENYGLFEQVFRNGDANFLHMRRYAENNEGRPHRFYIGWIFNTLAVALLSIDKLRCAAGIAEEEYALDIQLNVRGRILLGFTDCDEEHGLLYQLPAGINKLPRYAIGTREQFPGACCLVMEDILHLVGCGRSFDWNPALSGG